MEWKSSLTTSLFNFDYLPDEDGKKVDAKNKDEDEKIWKNEFVFEFFISKVGYMTIYMKVEEEKVWPIFKDIFHLSRQKSKCKWKQFGKMNLTFEFSISKLAYTETVMKICGKKILTHFLGHF